MLLTANVYGSINMWDEWDIELVVKAALENSDAIIQASEELRKREIHLQATKTISQRDLTISGEATKIKNPFTRKYEYYDKGQIELSISLTPKLVLGSTMILGEPASVYLNYYPFAENVEEAQAQLDFSLQLLELEKKIVEVELEARKLYITLLAAIKKRKQAEENLALVEQTKLITRRRYHAGLVGRDELDRAETEILEAKVKLASMKMEEYIALRTLSRLIKNDLSRSSLIELPLFQENKIDFNEIRETALDNNIELKKANLMLAFAKENLERVKKHRPTISFCATANTEDGSLSLSGSLTWKFEAIQSQRIEQAEIAVRQQQRMIETLKEELEDSLAIAIDNFELQQMNINVLEHKKNLAIRSSIEAQKKYENGEISLVDLEKVRLEAAIAQDDYIAGWNNLWQAWYVLLATIAA